MKNEDSHSSNTYVAFLRGINVGGHKKVPMADLRQALEKGGFYNPKTLLASGNVVFESTQHDIDEITLKFTSILQENFSFPIPLLIYPFRYIEEMVTLDPFNHIEVTKETRRYVTFLSPETKGALKLPYSNKDQSFQIMTAFKNAIFSVLILGKTNSLDAMNILEKTYGKLITTRNWNTVIKIYKLLNG